MNHREIYTWLLAPERREQLLQQLVLQGYQGAIGYLDARVVEGELWPYIQLRVPASRRYVAHSGGVYLDLRMFPEVELCERYYLPIVALVDEADPIARAHELTHVHDLLDLIERDPSYPARAEQMASYERADVTDMRARIDFEISKIFLLEPQAFRQEYQNGVTSILIPVFGSLRGRLPCLTEEEFVETWLADYVSKVEADWKGRFPHLAADVEEAVRESAEAHGRAVFGEGVRAAVLRNQADIGPRFLARVIHGDPQQ